MIVCAAKSHGIAWHSHKQAPVPYQGAKAFEFDACRLDEDEPEEEVYSLFYQKMYIQVVI